MTASDVLDKDGEGCGPLAGVGVIHAPGSMDIGVKIGDVMDDDTRLQHTERAVVHAMCPLLPTGLAFDERIETHVCLWCGHRTCGCAVGLSLQRR